MNKMIKNSFLSFEDQFDNFLNRWEIRSVKFAAQII